MLVSKSDLAKVLKTIDDFDGIGSPFAGMQWGAENMPLFHRSGPGGFIESAGYRAEKPDMIVSITHFKSTLARFEEDLVELGTDRNGVLTLHAERVSEKEKLDTTLHVHTIRANVVWSKTHDPGERTVGLPATAFQGINTGPFALISPPVLRKHRLMLPTGSGVILRSNVEVEAYPYPRESFLRTISGMRIEDLYLTRNGYWGAATGEFRVVVTGHRTGDALFESLDRAAEPLAEFSAARLTYALGQAASIAAKGSRVTLDPATGVVVRDQFGNDGTFSLGARQEWPRFQIPAATAQTLADALKQTGEETARLSRMDARTLRISRGDWEVSFGYFEAGSSTSTIATL